MEKKLDPQHLDVSSFARDGLSLRGEGALSDWLRLEEEKFGDVLQAGSVVWQLQGRSVPQSGGADQIWLDLKASVALPMQCQRCLTPVLETIEAERSFRFVADEATALAEDAHCEEDLLALTPPLDGLNLIEDELLMALPLLPKHDSCNSEYSQTSLGDAASEKTHPFAALAQWRKSGDPGK